MIKTITGNPALSSAVIIVCALFTYGGAVNLGWSGFAMAVPFMALWFLIARQSKKPIMIMSAIIFAIILGLYGLKKTNNDIFYPANGMAITLNKDTCFNSYKDYILLTDFQKESDCLTANKSIPDIQKSKIVKAGATYTITQTESTHADMGEQLMIHANDVDGDVYIFDYSKFNKPDGTTLKDKDLQQPYFYYPSVLMLWPMFPIFIFTVFAR